MAVRCCFWEPKVPAWGYYIPAVTEWGLKFPSANGESQSPININSNDARYERALGSTALSSAYIICRELDVINTGNTVVVCPRYMAGEAGFKPDVTPKSTLSGGPLGSGHVYELEEFRFHWGREDGRGSEHTVNLKAFPMELHLIHWNSSLYGSIEDALGKPDGIAIVALFIQIGREHSGLMVLTEQLQDIIYKGNQKTLITPFNPNCLLPDEMLRDYWTYTGSITSPPCCEHVTWVIFRYPLTISSLQMREFRRLSYLSEMEENDVLGSLEDGDDGALVDNFRPTQPINDRVVRASFQ